ncbi:MAG: hypothetical protein ACKVS8_08250 [Phycisphaerales bacterium]
MSEPTESRTLDDVRRWRREAHEQWTRLTPAQREAEEKRLIEQFGLAEAAPNDRGTGWVPLRQAS